MIAVKKAPGKEGNEKQHSKDNELQAVYDYLQNNTDTATMAAVALNIYRPNLCRRKRTLQKAGHLIEIKKGICPVTKHLAAFLSTNPALMPINSQLSLFKL